VDTALRTAAEATCFHCGLPVPRRAAYTVSIAGTARSMCCAGCAAVAQVIEAGGLTDYYRTRSALPGTPRAAQRELAGYDLPALQSQFTQRHADGTCEAALTLDGIRCAACAWINEQHIGRLAGVTKVTVNYSTQRMWVRWDERKIRLSRILGAVAELGYSASPYDAIKHGEIVAAARRSALKRFAIAGLAMMQVMMLAAPVYLAGEAEIPADLNRLLRWASLIITLPALAYCGGEFLAGAWRALRNRHVTMDVSVTLGLATAFVGSAWATLSGRGDVYFDSVTMFLFLLLGVRYLEQHMRFRAGNALAGLTAIVPASARRLNTYPVSRESEPVPTAAVRIGDHLSVAPGERVPVDAVVVEGSTEVDESLMTGESRPIAKHAHDRVMSGSINLTSPLIVRAEKVGGETTVAHISRLMERALAQKPTAAAMADRAAAWFVAALLVVAAATLIYWLSVAPNRAVPITIAMLVITCPCAISLAAPAALTAAGYRLARTGLVPARAQCIERLAQVTDVVIDKTGTLTEGRPILQQVLLLGDKSEAEALALAAALECGSEHPVGRALVQAAPDYAVASDVVNEPGSGIQGTVANTMYRIGAPQFVRAIAGSITDSQIAESGDDTLIALGSASGWIALLRFTDELRPEAATAMRRIQAAGYRVHLLSGDSAAATGAIADRAGIALRSGAASPAQKVDYVRKLQRHGAVVAMIGDGVNDAPSLAVADVSIAMGSGTDIAQSAADLLLLSRNLDAIPDALRSARRAKNIMRENLAWATLYNLIAIPFAAAGYVSPWIAAIGMSLSSLIVVANAIRLAPPLELPR
jgi:Cu2+-exporting ATPase